MTRRTPTSTTTQSTTCATLMSEHICALFSVRASHTCHTTLAQVVIESRHCHLHAIYDERFSLSCSTSPFTSTRTSSSFSFPSSPCTPTLCSDDLDSVTNNLRDSAKGSLVTYDDTFPLTGYEPNDTELINDTELNDSVPASSLTPRIPSSTLLRHQTRTWMTLHSASYSLKYTEKTPITAVRKVFLSVRRQCLSWSIERGNLWKKSLELLRSGKAPVHRLGLCSMNKDERSSQNVARKFLITNSKQLEQNKNAKFYRKKYGVSKRIFVKFINKILLRWRNYENSRVLPSIRSPGRSSSRIRTLLWNYQEDYKNCKMK